MGERFRDFDQFFAEAGQKKRVDPIRFTFGGEQFELPAKLPAAIPLLTLRLLEEFGAEADVPSVKIFDIGQLMFGEAEFQRLLGTGIDAEQLGEIIRWALEEYRKQMQESLPAKPQARRRPSKPSRSRKAGV